jgi:hypothetical protein
MSISPIRLNTAMVYVADVERAERPTAEPGPDEETGGHRSGHQHDLSAPATYQRPEISRRIRGPHRGYEGGLGMTALTLHHEPAVAAPATHRRLHVVCTHNLGGLPCVNPTPHPGDGRGCVHHSESGVPDRHDYGDDE